ncbi:imidazole glycerol phosphate synthase subunit HisH [Sphingomicrobium marinum]|uniref:imidazole glycerol phosphate synthase subunit HisH n=1 Tax=Sphingomicrobium marinum TaxID=1227950 RepID=UPI00223F2FBC|nr:imidazole glycerol phosphate synthase subunit HisH [Sphingomicrobium marinum]
MSLAILDLGYGNTESIRLAFQRLGADPILVSDPASVQAASKIVLPGVGNAGYGMQRLEEAGLIATLKLRNKPALGICLGMQMLFEASEETDRPLLGILKGKVRALKPAKGRPVPHMGWTKVSNVAPGIGLSEGDHLYFAHSFACPKGPTMAARVDYGGPIPAALRHKNWWAAQFHPERSSGPGANFLKAFLAA